MLPANQIEMSFKYTPNTLKKMEQLFEEARFRVRYEKGNFNSGFCVLEDRRIAVINRFLNVEGRINALIEILPTLQINEDELSGEMLKWYRQLTGGGENGTNQAVQTQMDL
jgi:molybdenum-dependent DNA-binding transcriptional regulator ModE